MRSETSAKPGCHPASLGLPAHFLIISDRSPTIESLLPAKARVYLPGLKSQSETPL